jgi:hypothetical protein
VLGKYRPESFDHQADLSVPRLAADPVQSFRLREACRFEEDAREFGVGVLAGVQETGLFPSIRTIEASLTISGGANHDSNMQVVGIGGHECPQA